VHEKDDFYAKLNPFPSASGMITAMVGIVLIPKTVKFKMTFCQNNR